MSAGAALPSFWQQQLVDEAVLAYVQWREESATVWAAYSRWASAATDDAGGTHAAYRAALDREEDMTTRRQHEMPLDLTPAAARRALLACSPRRRQAAGSNGRRLCESSRRDLSPSFA